jgi:hypothetical protein
MIRWNFLTAITFAVLGIAWAPVAPAQAPTAPVEAPPPVSSYTDTELKSFALAALDVERISAAYRPKLEAAKTAVEEQEVRSAASNEMLEAIQKQGMTVDKYREISRQVRESPEIAQRVQRQLRDAK